MERRKRTRVVIIAAVVAVMAVLAVGLVPFPSNHELGPQAYRIDETGGEPYASSITLTRHTRLMPVGNADTVDGAFMLKHPDGEWIIDIERMSPAPVHKLAHPSGSFPIDGYDPAFNAYRSIGTAYMSEDWNAAILDTEVGTFAVPAASAEEAERILHEIDPPLDDEP